MVIDSGYGTGTGEPAARMGDDVDCPLHGAASIVSGSPNTFINGKPAVRVGDRTACGDTIIKGSSSVFINGKPAAFIGCATAHGGIIIGGPATVFIGTQNSTATLDLASDQHLNERDYSLRFDFSEMHEAGNHNGISYVRMPVEITKPDGAYLTTISTDEFGMTDRFYTNEQQEIIAWADSGEWGVTEEYESIEDEDTSEDENG